MNTIQTIRALLMVAALAVVPAHAGGSAELCGTDAAPCLSYGAQVFQQRCALCHGSDGLGEGIMPMALGKYPKTNLMDDFRFESADDVRRVILRGATLDGVAEEMPPWGDELTHTQVESVVEFVVHMRKNIDSALAMLRREAANQPASVRVGRAIYTGRCALCHGAAGQGDGKMARLIKEPPPFNLTVSGIPDDYLRRIITDGGAALGRSDRMPPWGGDLSDSEIESVMLYVKSLRNYQ